MPVGSSPVFHHRVESLPDAFDHLDRIGFALLDDAEPRSRLAVHIALLRTSRLMNFTSATSRR
ncbi:MAG: hypothetical protein V8T86_02430, partial [Victivallis sp.]